MSRVRIPVELHRALGDYFERVWNCSFALQGEPCAASEIFHRNGFLPFIVELASRKSQRIFNRPIDAQLRPHENALLGKIVALPEKTELPVVLLLVWAAEQMFKPVPAQAIERYPIYAYHWTPTSMRTQGALRTRMRAAQQQEQQRRLNGIDTRLEHLQLLDDLERACLDHFPEYPTQW